jgi:putative nucleotidyltransferase with HDIG domain
VRPAVWYLNAALRTVRAFAPVLARPDDAFAASWLPPSEYDLYRRMDRRDRDHACRVARALLASEPDASPHVVRAALLHDVGKSDRPYRAWERIAVHLYCPADAGAAAAGRLGRLWWHHRQHAERGATMIVAGGGDADVAELVRRHHDADGPAGSRSIRRVDERT